MVKKKVVAIKTNVLLSKMVLFGDRQEDLKDALAVTTPTVSNKINGIDGAEFTLSEVRIIMDRYNLTAEEVVDIFLTLNDTVKGH